MTHRTGLYIATALLCLGISAAQASGMEDEARLFHVIRLQIDGAQNDEGGLITWQGGGWIGGDMEKFVVKTEGEIQNGHVEQAEIRALYSRNISDFWNLQAGFRQDIDPYEETYLVFGFEGLASYFFETEVHAFLSRKGKLSARLEQSIGFLLTQKLILEPHITLDISTANQPERDMGSGLSKIEIGAQLRYEITRKIAPYIDFVYERATGNTARFIRAKGDDPHDFTIRAGLRVWF